MKTLTITLLVSILSGTSEFKSVRANQSLILSTYKFLLDDKYAIITQERDDEKLRTSNQFITSLSIIENSIRQRRILPKWIYGLDTNQLTWLFKSLMWSSLVYLGITFYSEKKDEEKQRDEPESLKLGKVPIASGEHQGEDGVGYQHLYTHLLHSFRSLLLTVKDPLEHLSSEELGENLPSYSSRAIQLAKDNVSEVMGLLETLLKIAKANNSLSTLSKDTSQLTNCLQLLEGNLSSLATELDVTFQIDYQSVPQACLRTNNIKVDILLTYLVYHALQHTHPGGYVLVSADLKGSWLQLQVTNSSAAMSNEGFSRKHIFHDSNICQPEPTFDWVYILAKELAIIMGGHIYLSTTSAGDTRCVSFPIQAINMPTSPFTPKNSLASHLISEKVEPLAIRADLTTITTEASENFVSNQFTQHITPIALQWLQKVERHIVQEIGNKEYGVTQLSQQFHLSERQFRRRLKKLTGLSPKQYQQEIILHKAHTLLEAGQYQTVTAVAETVGINNATRFSKLFVERFGKHPQQYLL